MSINVNNPSKAPVASVFGRIGAVIAATNDYSFSQISGTAATGQIPNLAASIITTGQLALARGGTNVDLSAAGGTSQVLRQSTVGANITVSQLAASDLSNGTTGTGSAVLAASPTFTGVPLAPTASSGTNTTQISTTAFVTTAISNAVAGVNPAVAVLAASTANVVGTYTAVGSGIGDLFTVTATGTFSLDGIAINTIGQRILLKNQTDGTQNGVYFASVAGAIGVSAVFTRALDYDTPSDTNSTGAIPVQSGTVNTTTSWLLTSNIVTIGPGGSAFTYAQFSYAPAAVALLAGPAFTGTPTAPTATGYTNSTQIATTAYVDNTILGFGNAQWHEDFISYFGSASVTTGAQGVTSDAGLWALVGVVATGSILNAGATFAHPGVASMVTGAASGNGVVMYRPGGSSVVASLGALGSNSGWEVNIYVNFPVSTLVAMRAGFCIAAQQNADSPTAGIYMSNMTRLVEPPEQGTHWWGARHRCHP